VLHFLIRWKDQEIERLKRGGCDEREKQRGERRQEGAAEKPQREETDEEGEEKQVGWRVRQNKDICRFSTGNAPSEWMYQSTTLIECRLANDREA
jgi:hypothetical protein